MIKIFVKSILCFLFLIGSISMESQNLQDDFLKGKSFYDKNEIDEALPYFTRIFESDESELKEDAFIYVAETTLTNFGWTFSEEIVKYLQFLDNNATKLSQQPTSSSKEHYVMGLSQLLIGGLGNQPEERIPQAISSLKKAQGNKFPKAVNFLALAARFNHHYDKTVNFEEVIDAYYLAAKENDDFDILLDFQRFYYLGQMNKNLSEQDELEAYRMFKYGLDLIKREFPEHFPAATVSLWSDVLDDYILETKLAKALIKYFESTHGNLTAPLKKGYLYHNLYFALYGSHVSDYREEWMEYYRDAAIERIKVIYQSEPKENLSADVNSFQSVQLTESMEKEVFRLKDPEHEASSLLELLLKKTNYLKVIKKT